MVCQHATGCRTDENACQSAGDLGRGCWHLIAYHLGKAGWDTMQGGTGCVDGGVNCMQRPAALFQHELRDDAYNHDYSIKFYRR
jgi:hypothetical protein